MEVTVNNKKREKEIIIVEREQERGRELKL